MSIFFDAFPYVTFLQLVRAVKLSMFSNVSNVYVRCLVKVTKLNLGQYSEARFGQDFYLRFSRDADVSLRF